jgi:hypothetical protein
MNLGIAIHLFFLFLLLNVNVFLCLITCIPNLIIDIDETNISILYRFFYKWVIFEKLAKIQNEVT